MILHEYTSTWAEEFERLKRVYAEALCDLAIAIEHVGSTSIPGIKAKPIIDIDVVIKDYDIFPDVVERLAWLGYTHNGDQGILHREAFKRQDAFTPYTTPKRQWMKHHLYVCPTFSEELQRHLAFRDYLRVNTEARNEYERIKVAITARSDDDPKKYATIKEAEYGEFFERTLSAARNHHLTPPSPPLQ